MITAACASAESCYATWPPLRLMERIIRPHLNGHPLTVWEPFGGLASASLAARLGCRAFVAEPDKDTFAALTARLKAEV